MMIKGTGTGIIFIVLTLLYLGCTAGGIQRWQTFGGGAGMAYPGSHSAAFCDHLS
jgi:hypothetical protein